MQTKWRVCQVFTFSILKFKIENVKTWHTTWLVDMQTRLFYLCQYYVLLYKYGEVRKEEWFKEEFKNLADPKYRDETYEETFRVRDIVKAWWWKNKQHDKAYKAKIEKVNKNGTYDIVYEKDRKRETGVRPKYITKY